MRRLIQSTHGSVAVEAALFLPIFLLLTLGIADLGSQMFIRQQVNAAAQAGASYAVINSAGSCTAPSPGTTLSGSCLSGIQASMNGASGNSSFCTSASCTASIGKCADGSPTCVTVTASYDLTPMLPANIYTWAMSTTVAYTATIRIL
jgi:Flp pilus assembly protein TadG